jgi:hypothetical protein
MIIKKRKSGSKGVKPNFLFIGPDKTGSTWLYEILRKHPECYVPPVKDIYFFDRYYDRGMDWYLSFFKKTQSGVKAVGELSHDYLFSSLATERIARDLAGVKLLTCLRNPVERTFSNYLQMIRNGETRDSFEKALENIPKLIDHSMYHKHLSEYFRFFDRDHIKILFFEDLKSNPEAFAKDVFQFLNISFVRNINYSKKVLPTNRPRSYAIARMVKVGANAARNLGFPTLVGFIKRSAFSKVLYLPYEEGERPRMHPAVKEKLQKIFEPEVLKLQALLGKDLTHWFTYS